MSETALQRKVKFARLVEAFQNEVLPAAFNGDIIVSEDPLVRRAYAVHLQLVSTNESYKHKFDNHIELVDRFDRASDVNGLLDLSNDDVGLITKCRSFLKKLQICVPYSDLFIQGHIIGFQLTRIAKPMLQQKFDCYFLKTPATFE